MFAGIMPSIVNEAAALEDAQSDDQDIDPVQEIVEQRGEADLIEPAPQRFRLEPSDDGFDLWKSILSSVDRTVL